MSALIRCARSARALNRCLHGFTKITAVKPTKSERNLFKSSRKLSSFLTGELKRFYVVTTVETTNEQDNLTKEDRRQLQKSRKTFQHSEDYPAITYWKKYDYSKTRKLYNFQEACKNIYNALVSQKGISAAEFHDFMSLVEQRDDFTEDEVKLILKTVGFINKEVRGEEKVKWTEYLTQRFISLGIPLDVTYYNMVLRNYLQVNHAFSPVDFMSAMEKQGVAPNGVTLSRFVIAYCKIGDIKSASQVLEHMRSREMSINARVYNNLILGNFIAGDKDTAMQLFRDANDMGFTMDASMYHAAIVGNGLIGDLDGVRELVKEANDNMIVFTDGGYSTMIEQVAQSGRQDVIDYFLDLLTKASTFYYNECIDTLPVLMEQGNFDLAYRYFSSLSDPGGRLFYKAALLANMGTEDVVTYYRQMKKDNIRESSLLEYYALAVIKYLYEPAVDVLPHLEAEGETLRPHMMWPLIQYYTVMEDLEGLKKILPYMSTADGGKTVDMFLETAMKSLSVTKEEYRDILEKHSVFTPGQINACMIHLLISEGWKTAAEYAMTCSTVEDLAGDGVHLLGGKLLQGVRKSNWKDVMQILSSISNCSPVVEDLVVRNVLHTNENQEEIKNVMLEMGVKVNESVLPSELRTLLSEKELNNIIRRKYTLDQMKDMSLKELVALEGSYSNNIAYKACVLDKSYRAKKWDVYKQTLQSVDLAKIQFLPNVYFQAAKFYVQSLADVANCLKVIDQLKSNFPSFIPNFSGMVSLAVGVCQAGKYEDAIELLERYNYSDREQDDFSFVSTKPLFSLEPVPENIKLANRILGSLSNNGYLRRLRHVLVGYWNFISSCGDLKATLEAFEMLKLQYKYVPDDFVIVFKDLIKKGDKPSLQTAYDKFTDVVMEQCVLLSLAAAFVENGQIGNARKTLHTPGMRVMADNFRSICQRWATEGKGELIKEFTTLVGDLPGQVKKTEIMLINLRAMCNKPEPDVDEVIRYFEANFDEEDLQSNADAYRLYVNFLTEHKREIPFDKFTLNFLDSNRQTRNIKPKEQSDNPKLAWKQNKTKLQQEAKVGKDQEKLQEESLKGTEAKQNIDAEQFKTILLKSDFASALNVCKKLSTDEVKQLLPDDHTLLTKWADYLMNKYQMRELECIPNKHQKHILNGLFDGFNGQKLSWTCQKWRYLLECVPDLLMSNIPKMNIVDKTQCFTAALYTKDVNKVRAVKKLIDTSETVKFVYSVNQRMRAKQIQQDFGLLDKVSHMRDVYLTLLDSMDSTEVKAFAVSLTLAKFLQASDIEGVELLLNKAASSGLTFETVAELLPSVSGRRIFLANIQKVEEKLKLQNKQSEWEPFFNRSSKIEVVKTESKRTDLSPEKMVTDIATNIDNKKAITVVTVSEPLDVIPDSLSLQKNAEVITDTAKTSPGNAEPDMNDKADVISDQSSELGSKSEKEM